MSEKIKRLLLIGGGGHCSSVLDVLLETNMFDEICIIDSPEKVGTKFMGMEIIGSDNDLTNLYKEGFTSAFITLGSVKSPKLRIDLFDHISKIGFNIPNIISKTSIVSSFAILGRGIFVSKGAIINARSSIGNCAIINTGCIVEHDCRIGDFVHIAPGVTLSGGVYIGNNSHIGTNSTVIQEIEIGSNTLIGAGSVVVKSIGDGMKAFGNPCREV